MGKNRSLWWAKCMQTPMCDQVLRIVEEIRRLYLHLNGSSGLIPFLCSLRWHRSDLFHMIV